MIINYSNNGFQLNCEFGGKPGQRRDVGNGELGIIESLETGEMYGGNNGHHTDSGLWHHERSIECDQKEK